MGKGFGSKFAGLFVTSENEDSNINVEALLAQQTQSLGGLSAVAVENVIADVENLMTAEMIYKENGLKDESKSIFKVEEIKGVLPANLPTEAKKASVIGMMGVSGLTLDTILVDADTRTSVLNGALEIFSNETIKIVGESEDEIEKLEGQINILRETITSRKKSQEDQEKIIFDETGKIKNIVEFIK